jgi:hypothetical protein
MTVPSISSPPSPSVISFSFRFLITLLITEVGRFYGDGAKYKAVWDRMNIMNKNAKLLMKAVEAGLDPFKVELIDATPKGSGNKAKYPLFIVNLHRARFSFHFAICC